MLILVAFLLVVALGFLGYYTLTLWQKITQLNAELFAQKTRYDHDMKQWNDYAETVKTQYQQLSTKYVEESNRWKDYITALRTENQRLNKWKVVADADAKAAELISTAQSMLQKAQAEASNLVTASQERATAIIADAETRATMCVADADQRATAKIAYATDRATTIESEAKQQAKVVKEEALKVLDSATVRAAQIVESANKRAEEIAGSAYEAMKNASLYEQTARAMKNIITGYGDEYIIPEQSLLDSLAEGFSHTDAGQELKTAREHTRAMVRNNTAATCDYVEATRRETAIRFVVDAFNGKVDSILSRAKHDNAGKLEQEIRDAFMVVNFNGQAFRDARITQEYLAARLDELRWGAVAQQLALNEREEQRRIKEQIREEEKARKEYERAMRDAVKQEEMLRKAVEKAKKQIEEASAEQRIKYEQQLQELGEKLKQAEERNRRAMSMAQQTKQGHVYIISNVGSFGEHVYKIGLTRRLEPLDRVRELGDASVPFEFDVHAMLFSEDAPSLEKQLHSHFVLAQVNKVNHRKEFFRVNIKYIRDEIEKLGLSAKWTMTANARDFRETQAIDKAIKDDPVKRDAWVRRQLELELEVPDEALSMEPIAAGVEEE